MKKNSIPVFFALAKVIVSMASVNAAYDLQRDEYLYLDQGNHLAWGYLEVPPMLSVFSWLTKIMGGSEFIAHLWIALLGGLTVFMTGKIVMKLGGGLFGQILACTAILFSPFLRMHILYQANALDVFCWTMVCYYLVSFIEIDTHQSDYENAAAVRLSTAAQNKYLLCTGVWLGLGVLCKYSIGFLMMGLVLGVLATRYRRLFLNAYFYLSILIAFVVCSPNIWWQYKHRFPTFHHLSPTSRGTTRPWCCVP